MSTRTPLSRSFKIFFSASFIGSAGGQFTAVALPWLVLQLTGDAALVGTAFAVMAIPSAFTSLFGGALADRYSPKHLMVAARLIACLAACILGGTVLSGTVSLPVIYGVGILFSLAEATAAPAAFAMAPHLMQPEQYTRGNALIMGSQQIANIGGPGIAGALLAALTLIPPGASADVARHAHVWATGALFFVTAATDLVGSLLIATIRTAPHTRNPQPLLKSIGLGFAAAWGHGAVRLMIGMMLASMALLAASMVGIPLLVSQRLADNAAAFGGLMAVVAAGSLIGTVLAGSMPPLRDAAVGRLFLWGTVMIGGVFAALALAHSVWFAGACLAFNGIVSGFSGVFIISYLQRALPPETMGRVVSVVLFGMAVVRAPALLLAGVIADIGLGWLFVGGGLLVAGVALLLILRGSARVFETGAAGSAKLNG